MSMTNVLENIKTLTENYKVQLDKLHNDLKEEMLKAANAIFEKYPTINSFGCPGYTPYFNDGDPCTYRLNCYSDSVLINNVNGDDASCEGYKDFPKEAYKDVENFFRAFPKSFFEASFNEGVITVNRSGTVTVEDYDHG